MLETLVRFWRGYKRPDLTREQMVEKLQTKLVPHTTMVGAGHGLDAYLPVVPKQQRGGFPVDEMALVVYGSADQYEKIRGWKSGREYGREHDDIFEPRTNPPPRNSHSTVAQLYTPSTPIVTDAAYLLRGMPGSDWQIGANRVRILQRKPETTPSEFLAFAKAFIEHCATFEPLRDASVLVESDYLLVYENWRTRAEATPDDGGALNQACTIYQTVWLRDEAAAPRSKLRAGSGINVRFDPSVDLPNGDLPPDEPATRASAT